MRHARLESAPAHGGRIAVLDPDGAVRSRFDPLDEGPERALAPGVVFTESLDGLLDVARAADLCGILIRRGAEPPAPALRNAVETCRRRGSLVALDLSDGDLSEADRPLLTAIRPDVVVLGERLTGSEVPFGAFTGTEAVFAAWSRLDTAFLHSNTYGGNTLALRRARDQLLERRGGGGAVAAGVARAEHDWAWTLELYARHVNPVAARLHRRLRGALHLVRAEGSRVTVELDSGRRLDLLDGVCGGGLGVSGHSPRDLRASVLDRHDPGVDYVGRLEARLARETGLERTFPGVSGAGAVETALTLAMLAQRGRRRIVVFDHNYGGKTLISLIATAAPGSRAPFTPLYGDVRYLDPFAPDAVERFEEEAATGHVALVWIELVHGSSSSFAPVPDALLAAVQRERERRGFLVGVDEILTAYYRCGRRFAFRGRLPSVDIVTVSKALSYLCFPVAATAVSETVYEGARRANQRLVDELRTCHAHQLGAHIALHSIEQVDALRLGERAEALGRVVQDGVAGVDPASRSIGGRFVEGLFVRLEVLPPPLPAAIARRTGELFMLSTILWWIARARLFILYDCFTLHLVASADEAADLAAGIRRLSRTSPQRILWHGLVFMAREWLAAALRGRRRRRS